MINFEPVVPVLMVFEFAELIVKLMVPTVNPDEPESIVTVSGPVGSPKSASAPVAFGIVLVDQFTVLFQVWDPEVGMNVAARADAAGIAIERNAAPILTERAQMDLCLNRAIFPLHVRSVNRPVLAASTVQFMLAKQVGYRVI